MTHAIQVLSEVDEIILMSHGTITDRGSYKHLMSTNQVFAELIRNYNRSESNLETGDQTFVIILTYQKRYVKVFFRVGCSVHYGCRARAVNRGIRRTSNTSRAEERQKEFDDRGDRS